MTITVDGTGKLLDGSVLRFGEFEVAIPDRVPLGDGTTAMAPLRISAALKTLGLRFAADWRERAFTVAGLRTFPVTYLDSGAAPRPTPGK